MVIGAGSEMGPCGNCWTGANVHAVDLPTRNVGAVMATGKGFGRTVGGPRAAGSAYPRQRADSRIAQLAGLDVLSQTDALLSWCVRSTVGSPSATTSMPTAAPRCGCRWRSTPSGCCCPKSARTYRWRTWQHLTDVFAVPRMLWPWPGRSGSNDAPSASASTLHLANLFEPAYRDTVIDDSGREGDCRPFGPSTGPELRAGQTSAAVAGHRGRGGGQLVSLNVAPATRTRSVVKNRALAAAYAGAGQFGIEYSRRHGQHLDGRAAGPRPAGSTVMSNPAARRCTTPMDLFADAANHGGIWARCLRAAFGPLVGGSAGLVRPQPDRRPAGMAAPHQCVGICVSTSVDLDLEGMTCASCGAHREETERTSRVWRPTSTSPPIPVRLDLPRCERRGLCGRC